MIISKHQKDRLTQLQIDAPLFYRYAEVLSFAIRIEPILLRTIRVEIFPEASAEFESDIWHSWLVASRNMRAITFSPPIARYLKESCPLNFAKIGCDVIIRCTHHWCPEDQILQDMNFPLNYRGNIKESLRKLLAHLIKLKTERERLEFARWLKGALFRLAPEERRLEEALWLRCYTASMIGDSSGFLLSGGSVYVSIPEWMPLPKVSPEISILSFVLRPGMLFCLPGDEGGNNISFSTPLPVPIFIKEDGPQGRARWETIWPGKRIVLALGSRHLDLQTLDGKRFRLTSDLGQDGKQEIDGLPAKHIVIIFDKGEIGKAENIEKLLADSGYTCDVISEDEFENIDIRDKKPMRFGSVLWIRSSYSNKKHINIVSSSIVDDENDMKILRVGEASIPAGVGRGKVFEIDSWESLERSIDSVSEQLLAWLSDDGKVLATPETAVEEEFDSVRVWVVHEKDDLPLIDEMVSFLGIWSIDCRVVNVQNLSDEHVERVFYESADACELMLVVFPEQWFGSVLELKKLEIEYFRDYGKPIIGLSTKGGANSIDSEIVKYFSSIYPLVASREGWYELARIVSEHARGKPYFSPHDVVFEALIRELDDEKTSPTRRLFVGNKLSAMGDIRRGIGLRADGDPDIDWVFIPGGEFLYGDDKVVLTNKDFYISRYPVTNAQFQAFIDADGYPDSRWWRGLGGRHGRVSSLHWSSYNRPCGQVNWYEAVAYCRWLSVQLGYEVRLPTEEEWERAARGVDGREYPWGNAYRSGYANLDEIFGGLGSNFLMESTAVGLYPQGASPELVMDLAGNVWEWCLNEYGRPRQIVTTGSEPRVLRGGSWNFNADLARGYNRYWGPPDLRIDGFGFRVLCVSPIQTRSLR